MKRNWITQMSIWDNLGDICMFCKIRLQIDSILVWCIFDEFLWWMHHLCPYSRFTLNANTALMVTKRSTYRVSIDKEHNCIPHICQFGTIWVTIACFCKIRLQIDSISVLCAFDEFLWWMPYVCQYSTIFCTLC
jgi:hypothetical protein